MKPVKDSPEFFIPAEADIQKCAYFLWKQEGSPSGRDLDIWLRAKERVRHRPGNRRPRRSPGRRLAR